MRPDGLTEHLVPSPAPSAMKHSMSFQDVMQARCRAACRQRSGEWEAARSARRAVARRPRAPGNARTGRAG